MNIFLKSVGVFGLIFMLGCNSQTQKETRADINKQYNEFKVDFEKKLSALEKKIDSLESKTSEMPGEAKENVSEVLNDLEAKRSEISETLKELADSSKDNYADVKLKLEHSYEKLENEVNKAFN